jgi:hypothetical protein
LTPIRNYRNSGQPTPLTFDERVPGAVQRNSAECKSRRGRTSIEPLGGNHFVPFFCPEAARRLET